MNSQGLGEDVRSYPKAYGGTQIAIISLPMKAALEQMVAGKIKTDKSYCRLQKQVAIKEASSALALVIQ